MAGASEHLSMHVEQRSVLQVLDKKAQYQLLEDKYRREAFASLVAGGTPAVKAMRQAGWPAVEANRDKAMALLLDEDIRLQIRGHLDRLAETCMASKEMLIQELDFAREFAVEMENPAAVVAATLGKAKLMGYMEADKAGKLPAKIEITWNDDTGTHKEKVPPSSPLYDGIKDSVT